MSQAHSRKSDIGSAQANPSSTTETKSGRATHTTDFLDFLERRLEALEIAAGFKPFKPFNEEQDSSPLSEPVETTGEAQKPTSSASNHPENEEGPHAEMFGFLSECIGMAGKPRENPRFPVLPPISCGEISGYRFVPGSFPFSPIVPCGEDVPFDGDMSCDDSTFFDADSDQEINPVLTLESFDRHPGTASRQEIQCASAPATVNERNLEFDLVEASRKIYRDARSMANSFMTELENSVCFLESYYNEAHVEEAGYDNTAREGSKRAYYATKHAYEFYGSVYKNAIREGGGEIDALSIFHQLQDTFECWKMYREAMHGPPMGTKWPIYKKDKYTFQLEYDFWAMIHEPDADEHANRMEAPLSLQGPHDDECCCMHWTTPSPGTQPVADSSGDEYPWHTSRFDTAPSDPDYFTELEIQRHNDRVRRFREGLERKKSHTANVVKRVGWY